MTTETATAPVLDVEAIAPVVPVPVVPPPVRKTLTFNRKDFLKRLDALKFAAARNVKPILANAQIRWDVEGGVEIGATNLETCAMFGRLGTPAGAVVLPIKKLRELAKAGTSTLITLDVEGRNATVTSGGLSAKLIGEQPDEFPLLPKAEIGAFAGLVSVSNLRKLLAVRFAAAVERSRFAFNGVRFQREAGGKLLAIATDGKRMAVAEVDCSIEQTTLGHIVPTATLDVLAVWLKNVDGHDVVNVYADERSMEFRGAGWAIESRLVDGAFPKYESVIPKDAAGTITANRKQLLEALKQAKALTNEEARSVQFRGMDLSPAEGVLVLTSKSMDVGEAYVNVPATITGDVGPFDSRTSPAKRCPLNDPHCRAYDATNYDHEGECTRHDPPAPKWLGFNPEFVIEGLDEMGETFVTLHVTGPDTPARVDSAAFTYVIMPVTMRNA